MNKHTKKLIAPIIIVSIIVFYYVTLGFELAVLPLPLWGKVLAIFIPAVFAGLSIYVLIQRIKEIRSGEEDDLSKY